VAPSERINSATGIGSEKGAAKGGSIAEDTQNLNEPTDTAALIEQLAREIALTREILLQRLDHLSSRLCTLEAQFEGRLREARPIWSQMLVAVTALNDHAKETNLRLTEINDHLDEIEGAVLALNTMQQQIEVRVRKLEGRGPRGIFHGPTT
jgi:chromosome segregation ATPase